MTQFCSTHALIIVYVYILSRSVVTHNWFVTNIVDKLYTIFVRNRSLWRPIEICFRFRCGKWQFLMVLAIFVFGRKSFLPFRVCFRGQKSLRFWQRFLTWRTSGGTSSQKNLGGRAPECQMNSVSSVAIISSRWKNWGGGLDKKCGPWPPGPGLEPPLWRTGN